MKCYQEYSSETSWSTAKVTIGKKSKNVQLFMYTIKVVEAPDGEAEEMRFWKKAEPLRSFTRATSTSDVERKTCLSKVKDTTIKVANRSTKKRDSEMTLDSRRTKFQLTAKV